MGKRLDLQRTLEKFGAAGVYFQPPESMQIRYPAIVYSLDNMYIDSANDGTYRLEKRYQITVIDENPDSQIPDRVAYLPKTRFATAYRKDRLNHTVFNTYF